MIKKDSLILNYFVIKKHFLYLLLIYPSNNFSKRFQFQKFLLIEFFLLFTAYNIYNTMQKQQSKRSQQQDHKNEQQIQIQKRPQIQKAQPGSLQEQDNMLIQMLQSDKIIDIAIFVCFLGVLILSYCCYLLQGHFRFHLGFILFLMLGLGVSLIIYKCVNSGVQQFTEKNKHHHNHGFNQNQNCCVGHKENSEKDHNNQKQQGSKAQKEQ